MEYILMDQYNGDLFTEEKLYKVYAQCATPSGRAIEEADQSDVEDAIQDILDHFVDNGEIDFEEENAPEVLDRIANRYLRLFDEDGFLECGDYEIIKSEEAPKRPRSCGWSRVEFK